MNQRAMRIRGLIVTLIAGMILMFLPSISLAVDTKLIDDASTDSACPTCNYGGDSNLTVQQPSQKSYIKFDLSTLPAGTVGSNVAKATFRLWVNTVTTAGSFDIYNVTSAWTEEAITYNGAPTLGGLEVTAVSVTTASVRKFITVDLTALVKDWLNGVLVNNGIALIGNAAGTNVSFDSKENQGHSHEPRLEIELAQPEGDITAVFAGTGLSGGGTSGDVTLSIAGSYQLPQTCANGQVAKSNGLGGWACASDNDSGGTVTSVGTGAGLTGGPITTTGTISVATGGITSAMIADGTVGSADVNSAQVQLRVGGTCLSGNAIRVVNADGTVTCEATGKIDGSGTINNVPKFTAATTLGNSSISETGGNVGIGTTSPAGKLHVSGGANTFAYLGGDSTQRTVRIGADSGGFATIQGWATSDGLVRDLSLQASGGNVGIGTTNPGAPLEIAGFGSDGRIIRGLSSGTSQKYIHLSNTGGETRIGTESSTGGGFITGTSAYASVFGSAAGVPVQFVTSNAVRMTIDSVGNVGIGTASPTSPLHVIGDFTATGRKNFQIDHPLDPEKKFLVHSALEGPEAAVYYRGEAQLENGEATITLPSYFEALTRKEQRTVQLTPIKGWAPLYVTEEIQDGRFTVRTAAGGNLGQRFYWEIKAVRADVAPLVVEKEKVVENMNVASRSDQ